MACVAAVEFDVVARDGLVSPCVIAGTELLIAVLVDDGVECCNGFFIGALECELLLVDSGGGDGIVGIEDAPLLRIALIPVVGERDVDCAVDAGGIGEAAIAECALDECGCQAVVVKEAALEVACAVFLEVIDVDDDVIGNSLAVGVISLGNALGFVDGVPCPSAEFFCQRLRVCIGLQDFVIAA